MWNDGDGDGVAGGGGLLRGADRVVKVQEGFGVEVVTVENENDEPGTR